MDGAGQAGGGSWGLYEGLKHPEGNTLRLRINAVLNGVTKRGPALGNSLAVIGSCCIIRHSVGH